MKYRDPKTGEVFEDIREVHSRFCGSAISGRRCDECPLDVGRTGRGCISFRNAHPAEAARLMGLEIITDKEEPMEKKEKPRICEVLGVEVGEQFRFPPMTGTWFIASDGRLQSDCGACSTYILADMVNHPDRIIRRPRFSADEMAALRVLYAAGARVVARDKDSALHWYDCDVQWSSADTFVLADPYKGELGRLPAKPFPSLRPGQAVRLEDVLRGGEGHG